MLYLISLKINMMNLKQEIYFKEYVALIQGSIMMMNLYDNPTNYLTSR